MLRECVSVAGCVANGSRENRHSCQRTLPEQSGKCDRSAGRACACGVLEMARTPLLFASQIELVKESNPIPAIHAVAKTVVMYMEAVPKKFL